MWPGFAERGSPPMRPRWIAARSGPGTAGPSKPAQTNAPAERRVTRPSLPRWGGHRLRGRGDALARGAQSGRVALGGLSAAERGDRADDAGSRVAEGAPALSRHDHEPAAPIALAP